MITVLTGAAFVGGGILTGCKSGPEMGGAVFNDNELYTTFIVIKEYVIYFYYHDNLFM